MPYDDAFWMPPRFRGSAFRPSQSTYSELHDYDFEMRGPYRPGRLLDAYMEWRQFKRETGLDEEPYPIDALDQLRRWEEWRRERRHPELARRRRLRERRRGPVRGPRWPREGL